jgi:ATP-dependent 26S proteasome regulatory subunit
MINTKNVVNYLRAGFPVLWIKTNESERIEREVITEIEAFNGGHFKCSQWNLTDHKDPNLAIASLTEAPPDSVIFAHNFHWFIDKPPIVQALKNMAPLWANEGKHFVIVSHLVKIPPELEKDILTLDMHLIEDSEIRSTIEYIVPEEKYMPTEKEIEPIINASRGLTRKELESVYSLSLIESKAIKVSTINDYKAQAINKTGYLQVLRTDRTFDDVIGYDEPKQQILETIDNPKAKGIMLVGPPGTGKTSLAEAIVGTTGKFGLIVDMGKLFSKYIGDTDANVDFVINTIIAIGNCFVLIDEFEKQFAGAEGGGGDSGVTKRALSKWLNFLQNRPQGIYIAATANSFDGIPAEYLRPGRWDTAPFYIDLPSKRTRKKILDHYLDLAGIAKKNSAKLNDALENYSGAEVEALVNIATMRNLDLLDAKRFIIPVAKTMAEKINRIRTWAQINCIASDPEIAKEVKRKLVLN